MQYKLTLVTKTLPDASEFDCAPWGDKYEHDLDDSGHLKPHAQCRNDAEWEIQTHNNTILRRVCRFHLTEGMLSAYEDICTNFQLSPFAPQQPRTAIVRRDEIENAPSVAHVS